MSQTLRKLFFLGSLLCCLVGCGFHLRGHEPLPPQLDVLYLETDEPYGPLTKQLQQILTSIGVALAPDATMAPVTLRIIADTYGQQLTAQSSSGQLNTYILTYTLTYQLLDKQGRFLQHVQVITTSRSYTISANQVLGDTAVQTSLQNDMRSDAINQLLNRLRARNTQKALAQP